MISPPLFQVLLQPVTYVDLSHGRHLVVPHVCLLAGEHRACLEQWYGYGQHQFVPLPVLADLEAPGYSMSGRVIRDPALPKDVHGAAMLFIRGPMGEAVDTVGIARRPQEGHLLWRRLHELARTPVCPMDYPREPWIVRLPESGSVDHAPMRQVLGSVEVAIGMAWLRFQAYLEQERGAGSVRP